MALFEGEKYIKYHFPATREDQGIFTKCKVLMLLNEEQKEDYVPLVNMLESGTNNDVACTFLFNEEMYLQMPAEMKYEFTCITAGSHTDLNKAVLDDQVANSNKL